MRIVLLLFCAGCFSQSPIEFKILAINTSKGDTDYFIYEINYSVENKSDKEITFINCAYPMGFSYPDVTKLYPEIILSENGENLSFCPLETSVNALVHKQYDFLNLNDAEAQKMLQESNRNWKSDSITIRKNKDRILKISDFDYIKSAIIKWNPKEIRNFKTYLYRSKKRYFKFNDSEYYFDDSDTYSIQFRFTFFKKEFRYFFDEDVFASYEKDANFISGTFFSNTFPIRFTD